jgi:hypothetical protein
MSEFGISPGSQGAGEISPEAVAEARRLVDESPMGITAVVEREISQKTGHTIRQIAGPDEKPAWVR